MTQGYKDHFDKVEVTQWPNVNIPHPLTINFLGRW